MLKLDLIYFSWEAEICGNVVMTDNRVRVRCIFLNTSLLEKMTMSFLQRGLLIGWGKMNKWSQK